MMPQMVAVRVRRPYRRTVRLWIPVLPVLLVLSPLLLLAGVALVIVCLIYRISAIGALVTGVRVFAATHGTRIEVRQGRTAVVVKVW